MSIVHYQEFFMIRNFVIRNFVRQEFCDQELCTCTTFSLNVLTSYKRGGSRGVTNRQALPSYTIADVFYCLDTLKGFFRALNLTKNRFQYLAPKKVKKSFLMWSAVPKTQKCVVSFWKSTPHKKDPTFFQVLNAVTEFFKFRAREQSFECS